MRTSWLTVAMCFLPALAWPQEAANHINTKRVSFYPVEFVCPAAPLICCGSATKPILLQLERDSHVASAWLNRAGTIIAVAWKEKVADRRRAKLIASILEDTNAVELKGQARKKALENYPSSGAWYRGQEVDRLSEEETGVIATRLARRISRQISLTDEKAAAIKEGIRAALARRLIEGGLGDRSQSEEEMLAICRQNLNEKEIAILKEAHEKGAFSHLREGPAAP